MMSAVMSLGASFPAATSVATLPEPVRLWLARHVGEPTPAQRLAWPALAAGVLVGLAYWFAMGVDFPDSQRRFSRLA